MANSNRINSLFRIIEKWANFEYKDNEIKECYLNYIAYQYIILLTLINKKNCTKELKKEIYSYKYLLNYNKHWKVKLSKRIIYVFGLGIGRLVLKSYLLLKNKGFVKL